VISFEKIEEIFELDFEHCSLAICQKTDNPWEVFVFIEKLYLTLLYLTITIKKQSSNKQKVFKIC
jgi:hypothetical protein